MINEIGSEYNYVPLEDGLGISFPVEGNYVFSGRTAIETILKELSWVKTAMLPSYCCDSMIEPFRKLGIKVFFYPVYFFERVTMDFSVAEKTDVVLICNYFGFKVDYTNIKELINSDCVIIEDITHSLFSDEAYHVYSDYLVASVRKWEPIVSGGYCASICGKIKYPPTLSPDDNYITSKLKAMKLKTEYILDGDEKKKTLFLSMFSESNKWLADNYNNLNIDLLSKEYLNSINMEEQKNIRRRNAKILYEYISNTNFMFPLEKMDCPLFVPIISEKRDEIKQRLIDNRIYCPVHWPKPDGCESNIYDLELSLICDQRYNEKDMERLASVIAPLL